ncbi:exodeoxyribonuclease VII large subunit [Clostridium sp.]|uniref:exodeoxyribonuclease VII large subunit n=1 Tax=Clostridium sp. TaxID=1506 RepID=UPI002639C492|nr:exodeoxyribonuclease VII large subunit [Clostridium sp.]
MKIKTLTVTELNNYIKKTLDNDFILNNLLIKGEISNLKYHTSGHIYFSLKDSSSKINCVMFKSNTLELDFKIEEGMEVIVSGRCSIYQGTGSLQLYINTIQKEGLGKLHIKFEKLKEKLLKEGYFNEDNKKKIPEFTKRIGVVTSETGAVIRDIINVTRRRSSLVDIILYPSLVQGQGAYKTIIEGINYFNLDKTVDVIIIGRGGGSIEELWNFNEEELAKVIFNSKLPIISAVGHEVDYTISDFVSDVRASTPSQAAEIAVPLESEIRNKIENYKDTLNRNIDSRIIYERENILRYKKILSLNSPEIIISNTYLKVDNMQDRLNNIINNRINKEKMRIKSFSDVLDAHNPLNVLKKGYTIIVDNEDKPITKKESLKKTEDITIIFSDGKIKGKFISLK